MALQYRAAARIISRLPRGAFLPAPDVESAVLALEPHTGRGNKPLLWLVPTTMWDGGPWGEDTCGEARPGESPASGVA